MSEKMLISEEVYTHEHLWRMVRELLAEAKANPERSHYFLPPAQLIAYTAFEAFVNFGGFLLWPEIWAKERTYFRGKPGGIEAKLVKLLEKLPGFVWHNDQRPYQSIRELKTLRDSMAHGKVTASRCEASRREDGTHLRWHFPWTPFLSIEKADCSISDVKAFCQALVEAMRKVSDYPHLVHSAFEGSLASASGGPSMCQGQ